MERKPRAGPNVVRGHGRQTGHLAKRKTAQVADVVRVRLLYTGFVLGEGTGDVAGKNCEGSTWSEEE